MLGPCAGGAAYSPALTDLIIMVRKYSYMFLTGPEVIKAVTGEVVDAESLGGTDVHANITGTTVITSYSIHYTKLYEVDSRNRSAVSFRIVFKHFSLTFNICTVFGIKFS